MKAQICVTCWPFRQIPIPHFVLSVLTIVKWFTRLYTLVRTILETIKSRTLAKLIVLPRKWLLNCVSVSGHIYLIEWNENLFHKFSVVTDRIGWSVMQGVRSVLWTINIRYCSTHIISLLWSIAWFSISSVTRTDTLPPNHLAK